MTGESGKPPRRCQPPEAEWKKAARGDNGGVIHLAGGGAGEPGCYLCGSGDGGETVAVFGWGGWKWAEARGISISNMSFFFISLYYF
jgi:hypothetical protein